MTLENRSNDRRCPVADDTETDEEAVPSERLSREYTMIQTKNRDFGRSCCRDRKHRGDVDQLARAVSQRGSPRT